jgi:tetratricopeptide (TPR) repeat protein
MGRQSQPGPRLIERACFLLARAQRLRDQGKPGVALPVNLRSLALFVKHDRPGSLDTVNAHLEVGGALLDLGRYENARRSVARALELLRKRRGGGDVARLRHRAFIEAGHVAILQGRYATARPWFVRALRLAELHDLPPLLPARALNGLGMVAKYTRHFDESERFYRLSMDRVRRAGVLGRPMSAVILHNLGGLEYARGRLARAERFAIQGLRRRELSSGRSSVAMGADLAGLAAIVQARGRRVEAGKLYLLALSILRRRLGPRHFEVNFNVAQLAILTASAGRLAASRRLFGQAIPHLARALGASHPVMKHFASVREAIGP